MPFQSIIVGSIQKHKVTLIHEYPECYFFCFLIKYVNHQILIVSKNDYLKLRFLTMITFIILDSEKIMK